VHKDIARGDAYYSISHIFPIDINSCASCRSEKKKDKFSASVTLVGSIQIKSPE
jgi:hypothetical protein